MSEDERIIALALSPYRWITYLPKKELTQKQRKLLFEKAIRYRRQLPMKIVSLAKSLFTKLSVEIAKAEIPIQSEQECLTEVFVEPLETLDRDIHQMDLF